MPPDLMILNGFSFYLLIGDDLFNIVCYNRIADFFINEEPLCYIKDL